MSVGRQAALVTSGNVIAQLCQLAALPLIARLSDPAAFGNYTVFLGGCAIASVFAGMRYESAIVVALTRRHSQLLSWLVVFLGLAAGVVLPALGAIVVLVFLPDAAAVYLPALGYAALYIVLNTLLRISTSWFNRLRWMGSIGLQQIVVVVTTVASQLFLLVQGRDPARGLMEGAVAGQAFAIAWPLLLAAGHRGISIRRAAWLQVLAVARRYVAFPRYMIAYGLNSTIRERLIQILFAWGGGASALGNFAMAQRLSSAPHLFLHGGLGPALLGYARTATKAEVSRAACMLIELAAMVLIPVFTFIAASGPDIVNGFLGDRWSASSRYLQILALPSLVVASSAFVDRLFELYGQQRSALALELSYSVIVLSLMAVVGITGSAWALAITFAATFTVYHLYYMSRMFDINGLPRDHLRGTLVKISVQLACFAVVNAALLSVDSLWLRTALLVSSVFASGVIYYLWLGGRSSVHALFANP